ncbi:MAG: SUMF1/EgtB/PvdO family nonheme iron enzyme, partial [Gemmatimonadales bacterium]|nr:SUMF1/EgtB/PvdO family nonheme iron enzyme [Gemmatimonadales bacterium]
WHSDYLDAPADGSAWTSGARCSKRVIRGGSWYNGPLALRAANRNWVGSGIRNMFIGFRVARTLSR